MAAKVAALTSWARGSRFWGVRGARSRQIADLCQRLLSSGSVSGRELRALLTAPPTTLRARV